MIDVKVMGDGFAGWNWATKSMHMPAAVSLHMQDRQQEYRQVAEEDKERERRKEVAKYKNAKYRQRRQKTGYARMLSMM